LNGIELAPLVGVVVVLWVVQLALSYRQAIGMSRRIANLRRIGTVAVGLGRGRLKSRTYAVVAIDRSDRVVGLEVLSGWSNFSKPKPYTELIGIPYQDLCESPSVEAFGVTLRAALCQAVTVLREARLAASKADGGVAIAQQT
jgi:DNA-binding transcriptional regulator of glucitol operon